MAFFISYNKLKTIKKMSIKQPTELDNRIFNAMLKLMLEFYAKSYNNTNDNTIKNKYTQITIDKLNNIFSTKINKDLLFTINEN